MSTAEFARLRVGAVRIAYHLRPRYERLRARGYLTLQEIADQLHVDPSTVKIWRLHGLLQGEASDDRGNYLYPPDPRTPRKHAWKLRPPRLARDSYQISVTRCSMKRDPWRWGCGRVRRSG